MKRGTAPVSFAGARPDPARRVRTCFGDGEEEHRAHLQRPAEAYLRDVRARRAGGTA